MLSKWRRTLLLCRPGKIYVLAESGFTHLALPLHTGKIYALAESGFTHLALPLHTGKIYALAESGFTHLALQLHTGKIYALAESGFMHLAPDLAKTARRIYAPVSVSSPGVERSEDVCLGSLNGGLAAGGPA
jgi:hypothetical protein